jgi:threonine 3-dehydrogenase
MKALGKLKKETGLWLYDAPVPSAGPNDVLVKVKKTAICGTDVHIYKWDEWAQRTIPTPMTVGHEFVGVVEKVGAAVKHVKVGDRIVGEGHLVCGFCRNCRAGKRHLCRNTVGVGVHRTGCFAEYIAIPEENTVVLPPGISDEVASFLDPLGNAVHTALSFDLIGEDVLITGAGPIGIMAVAIAKHVGARSIVITDVNPYRLGLATKMGATRAVNVSNTSLDDVMQELNITEGFGVGLEMSGNISAFQQMIDAMSYGGKMALLGILPNGGSVDWTKVIFKSLFIKGIYGREMYETWHKMIAMLQSGLDVSPIITHKFPAHEFQKGFDAMTHGNSGKVILEWS